MALLKKPKQNQLKLVGIRPHRGLTLTDPHKFFKAQAFGVFSIGRHCEACVARRGNPE